MLEYYTQTCSVANIQVYAFLVFVPDDTCHSLYHAQAGLSLVYCSFDSVIIDDHNAYCSTQ